MSNVTIPVIDYKMDKGKLIVLVIVIAVIILATTNLGPLLSSLVQKILTGIGNAAGGVVNGVGQSVSGALGENSTTSDTDKLSAAGVVSSYGKSWEGNDIDGTAVSGPFAVSSFTNSGASNLDLPTLQSIVSKVWDSLGSSIFGMQTSSGDAMAVYNAFSPCQTQMDVSNVAVQYKNEYGHDLFYDITQGSDNVQNSSPAGDGQANVVWLAKLFTWASNLPVQ